jgi:uncharacterized RDD family membrane protein YckC
MMYAGFAGFWRRIFAYLIDMIVTLPLVGLMVYFSDKTRLFNLYWLVPGTLFGLWFSVYLVVRYGGTPGKVIMKIRIAMLDGSPVTYKAAMLRYSVLFTLSLISSIFFAISALSISDQLYFSLGYTQRSLLFVQMAAPWTSICMTLIQIWTWGEFVSMWTNRRKRAIHDFIASTVVIRSTPPQSA